MTLVCLSGTYQLCMALCAYPSRLHRYPKYNQPDPAIIADVT
jgi:hypothetical protein